MYLKLLNIVTMAMVVFYAVILLIMSILVYFKTSTFIVKSMDLASVAQP